MTRPACACIDLHALRHNFQRVRQAAGGSREAQIDAARTAFYEGFVAEAIDRFCRENAMMDVTGERHYGVLSGADMAAWRASYDAPLQKIEDLGDGILERIWSPDDTELYFLAGLVRSEASAARLDDTWYAYLYRHITDYGPRPWTIGVYLNTRAREDPVMQRLLLAALAGDRHR